MGLGIVGEAPVREGPRGRCPQVSRRPAHYRINLTKEKEDFVKHNCARRSWDNWPMWRARVSSMMLRPVRPSRCRRGSHWPAANVKRVTKHLHSSEGLG